MKLKKTADATGKYLVTELIVGRLVITEVEQEITPPSAVKGLVYDGSSQKLVRKGQADGGELRYSLDKWDWSSRVPTAKDAGTYTVYYMSSGDRNHRDTKVEKLTVTIAPMALDVKADQQVKRVGDPDPALTYTCATKLADGDKLSGELTRDKGERIGQYRIRIGTQTAGDNYDIHFKELAGHPQPDAADPHGHPPAHRDAEAHGEAAACRARLYPASAVEKRRQEGHGFAACMDEGLRRGRLRRILRKLQRPAREGDGQGEVNQRGQG